jgi:hypothetical protein
MSTLKSTFQLNLRRGIWRVTLDGAFYGDYRSKLQALEGAESGAQALRDSGRAAQVQVPAEGDTPQPRLFSRDKPVFSALRPKWGAK